MIVAPRWVMDQVATLQQSSRRRVTLGGSCATHANRSQHLRKLLGRQTDRLACCSPAAAGARPRIDLTRSSCLIQHTFAIRLMFVFQRMQWRGFSATLVIQTCRHDGAVSPQWIKLALPLPASARAQKYMPAITKEPRKKRHPAGSVIVLKSSTTT